MPFIHVEKNYVNHGIIHYHLHNPNRVTPESKISNWQKASKFLKLLVRIGVLMLTVFIKE